MLRTLIYLECSHAPCVASFPAFCGAPAPMDGTFNTPRQLRAEAKKTGWQRYGDRDYCPVHEVQHRAEALKGGK